jgi:hypothetical protein
MKLSDAFTLYAAESGALNTAQSHESYRKTVRQLTNFAGDKQMSSYTTAQGGTYETIHHLL